MMLTSCLQHLLKYSIPNVPFVVQHLSLFPVDTSTQHQQNPDQIGFTKPGSEQNRLTKPGSD